ncbi:MAG TPA: hypothetical protein DCS93_04090 [Microscillaceae bacterium]|nr:hypothetical protein [Microscillaceae bacterium]
MHYSETRRGNETELNLTQQNVTQQKKQPGTVQTKEGQKPSIQAKQGNRPPIQTKEGQKPPIQAKQGNKPLIQTKEGQKPPIQAKDGDKAPIQSNNGGSGQPNALPNDLIDNAQKMSPEMGEAAQKAVWYKNSPKPKEMGAKAIAQGKEIHTAQGEEKHLGHELEHIRQQAQGEVQPTTQAKDGTPINDNKELENKADRVGDQLMKGVDTGKVGQLQSSGGSSGKGPAQQKAVAQLVGEREAVEKTLGDGINTHPMRRGNRRGSVYKTKGDSRVKRTAMLMKFTGLKKDLLATAKADIEEISDGLAAEKWITNNANRINAYALQVAGIGNCGEFGNVVYSELLANTNEQYVARCTMYPQEDFDHGFAITYPAQIPTTASLQDGSINVLGGAIDIDVATVADGWDGYKVMTLRQFLEGGNAYRRVLNVANVKVISSERATGADTIDTIKPKIQEVVNQYVDEYEEERDDPDHWIGKRAAAIKDKVKHREHIEGLFPTEGYHGGGELQDIRPLNHLLHDGSVPLEEKRLAINIWRRPVQDYEEGPTRQLKPQAHKSRDIKRTNLNTLNPAARRLFIMHLNWRQLRQLDAGRRGQLLHLLNNSSDADLEAFIQKVSAVADNPNRKERVIRHVVNNDDLTAGLARFNLNTALKIFPLLKGEETVVPFLRGSGNRLNYLNRINNLPLLISYFNACDNGTDLLNTNNALKNDIVNGLDPHKIKQLILTLPNPGKIDLIGRLTRPNFWSFYQALSLDERGIINPLLTAQQRQWYVQDHQVNLAAALGALGPDDDSDSD